MGELMLYVGYDPISYLLVTSLRAVVIGAAVTVAKDVLPVPRRFRVIFHWLIVAIWLASTSVAALDIDGPEGLRPRALNAVMEVYLVILLALHALWGPWSPRDKDPVESQEPNDDVRP